MRFLTHPRPVKMLAYTPEGKLLFTCDGRRTVRAWNLVTGEQSVVVLEMSPFAPALAQPLEVSPDGRRLAVRSAGLVLCEIGPIPPPSDRPTLVATEDPDEHGFQMAPGWTFTRLQPIHGFTAFSPDWTTIASLHYCGAHFWELNTSKWQGGMFGLAHAFQAAAFSADGKTLATSVWEAGGSRILFWDVARRRPRKIAVPCYEPSPLVPLVPLFSPDGRWFAVFHEAQAEFFDARSGRMTPEGSLRNATRQAFPGTSLLPGRQTTADGRQGHGDPPLGRGESETAGRVELGDRRGKLDKVRPRRTDGRGSRERLQGCHLGHRPVILPSGAR